MNLKNLQAFLTVARKYSYNCVYIFHSIHLEKIVWRTILSQTNIYNIFPATVPLNNVKKILEGACIRKTSKYIPQSALWISRLFIELANKNEKVCLTLDCSNTNRDGPGRFCTKTDYPEFQTCYFNSANDEQVYNEFISERIKACSSEKSFQFKIIELKSRTNSELTFDASQELRNLTKNDTSASRRKTTFVRGAKSSARGRKLLSSFESVSSAEESDRRVRKRAKPGFLT